MREIAKEKTSKRKEKGNVNRAVGKRGSLSKGLLRQVQETEAVASSSPVSSSLAPPSVALRSSSPSASAPSVSPEQPKDIHLWGDVTWWWRWWTFWLNFISVMSMTFGRTVVLQQWMWQFVDKSLFKLEDWMWPLLRWGMRGWGCFMEENCGIQSGEELQVSWFSCADLHQPVLDSGSDTIVLPASLAFAHGGALWDGQGNQIATAGCRQVERELWGEAGDVVVR